MASPIEILTFGSDVLSDRTRLPAAVLEVYRAHRRGRSAVAVVPALSPHTDVLVADADYLSRGAACGTARARLLDAGAQQAAALFGIAAEGAGLPAIVLDAHSINYVLMGERLDADPYAVNRQMLLNALAEPAVAVLPGLAGRHLSGGTAWLGEGGADLTGIFLADQLDACECRLIKSVDGIRERELPVPANSSRRHPARRYATLTCDDALRVATPIIAAKALEYLHCVRRRATVTGLVQREGTVIGSPHSCLVDVLSTPPVNVGALSRGSSSTM